MRQKTKDQTAVVFVISFGQFFHFGYQLKGPQVLVDHHLESEAVKSFRQFIAIQL